LGEVEVRVVVIEGRVVVSMVDSVVSSLSSVTRLQNIKWADRAGGQGKAGGGRQKDFHMQNNQSGFF